MDNRKIYITNTDHAKLKNLLDNPVVMQEKTSVRDLVAEMNRAVIVSPKEIPFDVVTMRSQVRIKDRKTKEESVLTLAFPNEADIDAGKISVLAPVGTALLGYRAGDVVEWNVPAGTRTIEIVEVIYQPEASGNFHV